MEVEDDIPVEIESAALTLMKLEEDWMPSLELHVAVVCRIETQISNDCRSLVTKLQF